MPSGMPMVSGIARDFESGQFDALIFIVLGILFFNPESQHCNLD